MPKISPYLQKKANQPVVLVAGGAGFLGSHLSESLLRSGSRVVAIDDFITGKKNNIEDFRHHPQYQFFEGNINEDLPRSFADLPITHILHAAAIETYHTEDAAQLSSLLTSSLGTKNLLDLAASKNARMLLCSSINIYEGLASSTSLQYYFGATRSEEAQYAQIEAKRYAETLCEIYARMYHLDVRVGRLSQVYGPKMELQGGSILTQLMTEALQGGDLKIASEGSREVLLTYVSDAVYGLIQLLFADQESYAQAIYQFANPERISILSIAYTLRQFLKPGKEVVFLPEHDYQALSLPALSIERTKRDLSWEPLVDLTEGLKRTMDWFKEKDKKADKG